MTETSDTTQTTDTGWHRTLPDHVTVTVAGTIPVDPDGAARPSARIVLSLPDYAADTLAHALADACNAARVLGGVRSIGEDERAIAEALYQAANTGTGHRCTAGGLTLLGPA